jgi:phage shock protein PspC (stress-responsive transcriptional regulator)
METTTTDTTTQTGTGAFEPGSHDTGSTPPPAPQTVRRLYRTDGPVSGVSAGLADYLNIDVTFVRLGLVAGTLIGGPIVPIGYVAAWAIIPQSDPVPVAPIMAPNPPAPAPAPVPPVPVPPAPAPAPASTAVNSNG